MGKEEEDEGGDEEEEAIQGLEREQLAREKRGIRFRSRPRNRVVCFENSIFNSHLEFEMSDKVLATCNTISRLTSKAGAMGERGRAEEWRRRTKTERG